VRRIWCCLIAYLLLLIPNGYGQEGWHVSQSKTICSLPDSGHDLKKVRQALANWQRNPDDEASFFIAWGYYPETDDWKGADKMAREVARRHPEWATVHVALGKIAFKELDEDLAVAEFKQAIKLKPCWPHARITLSDLYLKIRKYKDALETAEEGLKILVGPEHWIKNQRGIFLSCEGRAYTGLGDYKNAIAKLEKFETLNLPWYDAIEHFGLANAYVQDKQWKKAIPYIEKAMPRDPNQHGYFLLLARAYAGNGQPKEALAVSDRYMELMNKAGAALRASQVLDEQKMHELRVELYTKLAKHDLARKEQQFIRQNQKELYEDSFFMEKDKPARRR